MTSKSRQFRTQLVSVALASAFFAPTLRAEESANAAAAQGLFDDAKALMASGRAAEACPKLEESQRLDPGSGTLINLAKCYEDTGRVAAAWSTYLEAASAASVAGNAEREKGARERAAALAPRVSRLVIEVPADARVAGLAITRDRAPVGAPQWGVAVPTDAGEHAIEAKAPGHEPWRSVAVVKGEGTTGRVAVPKLAESAPAESAPANQDAKSSGLGAQRIAALVSGGIGVAGLVVGSVFGLKAMSDKSDADKACNGTACSTEEAANAGNSAHSAGNVATIGMIVGAVGVAGGLTLWFTAPKERPSTEVGVGLGTVALKGTW